MRARFYAIAVAVASLAGCAADPSAPPGPARDRDRLPEGEPGIFGDLRWKMDMSGKKEPVKVSEEAEFAKWKASNPSSAERREFEEWRAYQEWKRQNPK